MYILTLLQTRYKSLMFELEKIEIYKIHFPLFLVHNLIYRIFFSYFYYQKKKKPTEKIK